jgi:hypothetical protein
MIKSNNFLFYLPVLILVFLVYYLNNNHISETIPGFQYRLAQAFINGHTYIAEIPQLSHANDPYDPKITSYYAKNPPYVHDASFYNGKIYLYYGPVPALIFFIPLILLNFHPTDFIATLFFVFGSFVFQCLIFLRITPIKYKINDVKVLWFHQISILVLAFSTPAYYILQFPRVYELAMASSLFFLSGSILFLIEILFFSIHKIYLFLISLFLILALGSRITIIFPACILLILSFIKLRVDKKNFYNYLFLFLPFFLGFIALLFYNYIRFDSFTEFGTTYIMSGFHPKLILNGFPPGTKLSGFINLIYEYLFNTFKISNIFPYIFSKQNKILNLVHYDYPNWGIISCFPIKWILFFLPITLSIWRKTKQHFLIFFCLSLIVSSLLIIIFLCLIPFYSYRYLVNINFFLTITSLILWCQCSHRLWYQDSNKFFIKRFSFSLINFLFIVSAFISILFGFIQ